MPKEYQEIGKVSKLFRYPVKSMRGEEVAGSKLGWHGLQGDRRFAFLRVGNQTGLPWLSVRQFPKLLLYSPRIENPTEPDDSPVIVTTPHGTNLSITNDQLRSELEKACNVNLSLIRLWRGAFDSMSISLISDNSIHLIAKSLGQNLEVERFRPNIVMDLSGDKAFPEDKLLGELLVFGDRDNSARVRLFRKDPRCMVINLDPSTGVQDPSILREVVKNRKNFLGAYGGTERPGTIQAGDSIFLVKK